jgi:hypothetical protein
MPKPAPTAAPESSSRRVPLLVLPLWWVWRLFTRPLTLVRDGKNWHVSFVNSRQVEPPKAVPKTMAAKVAEPAAEPACAMQTELRALLGRHAETRQLMRHLAYAERTLRLGGPDALDRLPPEIVRRSLQQLEGLVDDWSTPGLAELRLRLAMARDASPVVTSRPPDSNAQGRVEVSDASESVFEAVQRGFERA